MIQPVRLRLSRAKGFDLQAVSRATNALPGVNAARPGALGNCFVVGIDGNRDECVRLHRYVMSGLIALTTKATVDEQRDMLEVVTAHRDEYRGHNVFCWCRLDGGPCHGDTLIEIFNPA